MNAARRIIPARAGFTADPCRPSGPCQDHPRSRGVYIDDMGMFYAIRGSSPLARGLPGLPCAQYVMAGIIPARAGFTCEAALARSRASDHPRSRGVYAHSSPVGAHIMGSSPLARGLREM